MLVVILYRWKTCLLFRKHSGVYTQVLGNWSKAVLNTGKYIERHTKWLHVYLFFLLNIFAYFIKRKSTVF